MALDLGSGRAPYKRKKSKKNDDYLNKAVKNEILNLSKEKKIQNIDNIRENEYLESSQGSLEESSQGSLEGSFEGSLKGSSQGSLEESSQGSLEGSSQGSSQGSLEGSFEGSLEGSSQGSLEGSFEGSLEGSSQGSSQGSLEGLLGESSQEIPGGLAATSVASKTSGTFDKQKALRVINSRKAKDKMKKSRNSANKTEVARNKSLAKLKSQQDVLNALLDAGITERKIIVAVYKNLNSEDTTDVITPDEFAKKIDTTKGNFNSHNKSTYRKGLIDRVRSSPAGIGTIYWLPKKIKKALKELEKIDPTFF